MKFVVLRMCLSLFQRELRLEFEVELLYSVGCIVSCAYLLLSCPVLIAIVLANVAVTCLVQRSINTGESNETGGAGNVLLVLFWIIRV